METIEKTRTIRHVLADCRGFGVYGPNTRIGEVEEIRCSGRDGSPRLLLVRAGLLGSWLVHVPVDQVDDVDVGERRIRLRPGGLLAGPRTG